MTGNKKIIIAIAIVIAAAVIALASVFALRTTQETHYTQQISMAEEYLAQQDYNNAVAAFKEAIREEPENEEAYIGLANIYLDLGQFDDARAVLEDGLSHTDSKSLQDLIEQLQGQSVGSETKQEAGATVDLQLLSSFNGRTYQDYERKNGIESALQQQDGSVAVRARGIRATMVFRNSENQPNAVDGSQVMADSLPEELILDNIMELFGGAKQLKSDSLNMLDLTDLKKSRDKSWGDIITFTADDLTITVALDEHGNIVSGANNRIQMDTGISKNANGTELKGSILDAQDGKGVAEAKLTFRKGSAQSGEYAAQVYANASGAYETKLEGGDYTVEISKDGYITEYKEVYINSYGTKTLQDFTITKEVNGGEVRIVLNWGSAPGDLDAHLLGNRDGGSQFHVDWINRKDGNNVAELDYDVQSGYGPETITIHDTNGTYHYLVHDYTRSGNLASSGAEVTVYMPGENPVTINVNEASLASGDNVWDVLTIDHGKLTVNNTSGDESSLY